MMLRSPAFRQLALTNLRELVRDPTTFVSVLLTPLFFLALFFLIATMMGRPATQVGVSAPRSAAPLVRALGAEDGVQLVPVTRAQGLARLRADRLDVLVTVAGGRATVTAGSGARTKAAELAAHARRAGPVTVAASVGDGVPDARRVAIPAGLMLAFAALALFGTASPLIALRQRGTLRLLRTTPMSRLAFVLAQVPARFGIGVGQLTAILALTGVTGQLGGASLGPLLVSALLGLAMLFAVGYCLGGVIRSPEAGNGALAAILPVCLMLSGVLFPLTQMPALMRVLAHVNPLTYFGDALRQALVGVHGSFPLALDWLVMAAVATLLTAVTVRTFRWEEEAR
jgi:ABC-2 type transport system permease protein